MNDSGRGQVSLIFSVLLGTVAGPYFSELRTWLEDVTLHDSNTLCRSQATVLVKATSI